MTAPAAISSASVGDGGAGGCRHLAIIMDGNGRWSKAKRLPRIAGHREGVEAVRRVVEAAPGLGLEMLTLYAFSSENWKRPADEVSDLMGLLRHYVKNEIDTLHRNGVCLDFIGDWRALKPDLVSLLEAGLDTAKVCGGLSPPDAVLRTSGELRLSNFLLWQTAYAEFLVTETLWPDFDGPALAAALDEFSRRERRFGGR